MKSKQNMSRSQWAAQFRKDFAPLERSLARGKRLGVLVGTPEMLIVELNLTPAIVRTIEAHHGVHLHWFAPTYSVLARHGLLPGRKVVWDEWLKLYHAKKAELRAEERREKNRSNTKQRKRSPNS